MSNSPFQTRTAAREPKPWQMRAACRGQHAVFSPSEDVLGNTGAQWWRRNTAPALLEICATCPVLQQCSQLRDRMLADGLLVTGVMAGKIFTGGNPVRRSAAA